MQLTNETIDPRNLMQGDVVRLKDDSGDWYIEEISQDIVRLTGDGLTSRPCTINVERDEIWLLRNYDHSYTPVVAPAKQRKDGE